MEKALESDLELNAKYRQSIDDYLQKGYIKPGKVRRVSDTATKYQGTSLNDHLLSGPGLLNSVAILMRFCQELIAMSADIEAMFNQVAVLEE